MLITLTLIVHTLIAAALVGVILLQRSEGGGLGIGGGNAGGLVSARGAADLMTRSTNILAAGFIVTSLLLAVLYGQEGKTRRIDPNATTAARVLPQAPVAPPPAPIGGFGALPFGGGAPATAPIQQPAPNTPAPAVPLAK